MARLELTPSVLIEKYLVPLLSATKTKFFQYKGKIIESRAVPDHHTRLMALDMVFRMMGAYAQNQPRRSPVDQPGVRVVMQGPARPPRPDVENSAPICLPALPSQNQFSSHPRPTGVTAGTRHG
jgi:hypothetical protein